MELHQYPFTNSMSRCDGRCNSLEDPFGRICVPNKVEDVNLKVINVIKGTNKWSALLKQTSCECRCESDGRKCNSTRKWNDDKCQWE